MFWRRYINAEERKRRAITRLYFSLYRCRRLALESRKPGSNVAGDFDLVADQLHALMDRYLPPPSGEPSIFPLDG